MTAMPGWFPSGSIHRTLVYRLQTSHSTLVNEIGEERLFELVDAIVAILQDESRLT